MIHCILILASSVLLSTFAVNAYAVHEFIDNFDDVSLVAAWWGNDPTAPYAYTADLANDEHVHSGQHAMRLDYDKGNDSNLYSSLAATGAFNLRTYDYMSFWVYNDGTPVQIGIRIEDEDMNAWESSWAAMTFKTKTASADWENIVVDLSGTFYADGAGSIDMSRIKNIMFFVQPGDGASEGTIWFDDFMLHRAPQAPMDIFERDSFGWYAGAPFVLSMTNTLFHNDGTVSGLGQQALKVQWASKTSGQIWSSMLFCPDHDKAVAPEGRFGNWTNFLEYGTDHISMFVRSTTDNNIPILLKFNTEDVGTQTYNGGGAWQKLSWNYSSLSDSVLMDVTNVLLFPYPGVTDNGGILYIDDVMLDGSDGADVPKAPLWISAANGNQPGVPDGDGFFRLAWTNYYGDYSADSYLLQEDTDANFGSPSNLVVSGVDYLDVTKDPVADEGTFYYRICSVLDGEYSSFGRPVSVEVKDIPDPLDRVETISDFDGNGIFSLWWAQDPEAPYVYEMDFMNTDHAHNGDFAMKVVYDKSNGVVEDPELGTITNSYSFYALTGEFNFHNFDYLSMWVYNTGSPLRIKIRLEEKDNAAHSWESDWAGIFPEMRTPEADWENLVVDLTRTFTDQLYTNIDMTSIGNVLFIVDGGDEESAGEFWMDDIKLLRSANTAPFESFESDFYGWAAGDPFAITNSWEDAHNGGTGMGQRSLKVTWGAKGKNYSNFTYEPRHDNDAPEGRIGKFSDFTINGNSWIECWVKSDTETEMPVLLKYDDADLGVRIYQSAGDWQRMVWEYDGISGAVDVEKIFFIPYPDQADNGGVMYVDDFNLLAGSVPEIPWVPELFTTTARYPDGDGVYTVDWAAVPGCTAYILEEATNSEFKVVNSWSLTSTNRSFVKNPVADAGTYYYRVKSVMGVNTGNYSGPIQITIKDLPESEIGCELVDTFGGGGQISTWWTLDSEAPYVFTMDFGSTQHVHSGTVALEVEYDKNNDERAYSFFSALGLFNLRNYDYLSFWVYNDGSPLTFRIRLEDEDGNGFESNWAGMEPSTQTPEADWENLVLDLTRTFGATNLNLAAIKQIMFMVAPTSTTETGLFYMDDITLHRAVNSAPLDCFENDIYGWAAGTPFVLSRSSNEFHNTGEVSGLGQFSFMVEWDSKERNYSNITYEPGHDTNNAPLGRVGNYRDFTVNDNNTVEMWAMSTTDDYVPILLKLDDADVDMQYITATGEWQRLVWDYSELSSDLCTNVEKIFVIPYPNMSDADGGVLYFDDLNLIGGHAPVLPTVPSGLDATYPDSTNYYSISWEAEEGMDGYELQESLDSGFSGYTAYEQTGTTKTFDKDSYTEGGTYYYRVRSYIMDGENKIYGAFGPVVRVYIAVLSTQQGNIRNLSYETDCAEMDNINIPFMHTNVSSYRVTVTHPDYYPVNINERGADFDDCTMTDGNIWYIGETNGSWAELKTSGYTNGDVYYAEDEPHAGLNEPYSEFPYEINETTHTQQDIYFTADTDEDVNIEVLIGAKLTVVMKDVSGTLELRMLTWDGTAWTNRGSCVVDSVNTNAAWDIPDHTWIEGVDANRIRLQAVSSSESSYTTPGAWARYDFINLSKRAESGETVISGIYDFVNVVVDVVKMDFWWRDPEGMTVTVMHPELGPIVEENIQYFRIITRVPDATITNYSQIFVMYEDGNVRLLPSPPSAMDWMPFGSSVIMGPTEDCDRPFVGVESVVIHPLDLGMDVTYDDGVGSAHFELWVDQEQHVVDVTDIQYDTENYAFARFRSMWVFDGKADIDRVSNEDGRYPIMEQWSTLFGTWWAFDKEIPTYHNTYCPNFMMEVTGPSKAYLIRQAETCDWSTNCVTVNRGSAAGGEAINMSLDGAEAVFNIYVNDYQPDTRMLISYSDDDGGDNATFPGNLVEVYVDGELKDSTHTSNTDGWDDFETLPGLMLGDIQPGNHQIRIVTGPQTFGMDMDEFQLVSYGAKVFKDDPIETIQAEDLFAGSNYYQTHRSNDTEECDAIHVDELPIGEASYNFTLAQDVTNAYLRIRYADDVSPNKLEMRLDDKLTARVPTDFTGGWNDFTKTHDIYLGDMAAGVHRIDLYVSSDATTYGVDLDLLELFSPIPGNNPPYIIVPQAMFQPVGSTVNFSVSAYDPDGDDVVLSSIASPAGTVFNDGDVSWTIGVDDFNQTNIFQFRADDGQGQENSICSNAAWVVVPFDYNEDGVDDGWAWNYFGTLEVVVSEDPDGDGQNNGQEAVAGTDPLQAGSYFEVAENIPIGSQGCRIHIDTIPGRRYCIYYTDSLDPVSWYSFTNMAQGVGTWLETGSVESSHVFVDDFTESTSGSAPVEGVRYYRVGVTVNE